MLLDLVVRLHHLRLPSMHIREGMGVKRSVTVRERARAIFKREQLKCAGCGLPIDYSLRYPHPRSMVADHIIPLQRGGADVVENMQPLHRACNSTKAASLEDRLVRSSGTLVRPQDP